MVVLKIISAILTYPFRWLVIMAALITLCRDGMKGPKDHLKGNSGTDHLLAGGEWGQGVLEHYKNSVPVILQYVPGVALYTWLILHYWFRVI